MADSMYAMDNDSRISPNETVVFFGTNLTAYDKEKWAEKVAEVVEAVERDGSVQASWSCTGRTRHCQHGYELREALPQYDVEVGYDNYRVRVFAKPAATVGE